MNMAHRVSWKLHFGAIEKGISICHKCDNPPCVRPTHLFSGTQSDNLKDAIKKGRHKAPDGTGERNGSAVLTESNVLKIRANRMKESVINLAKRFSVTPEAIYAVLKYKTWKHLI